MGLVGAGITAAQEAATGALVVAMDKLKDTLRDSIAFADSAQKASLALGLTYKEANQKLTPTMEGLRGDLNEKFAAGIAGMEVGLQGNTAGLARLVNQQRLTGTQSAKTAKTIAGLETSLGLSREQTNRLASNLVDLGEDWQISTDNLVNALDSLKATFPAQALAGMGDKTMTAMTMLAAELPVAMHGQLESVMKMILDTGEKGYERLVMLGIGGVREQLSASKNSEEAAKILRHSFKTAALEIKKIGGGAEDFYLNLGIAAETFGPAAINFTTVAENLGKRQKEEQTALNKFADTLKTLTTEILEPLQEQIALHLYPILKKLVPVLKMAFIGLLEGVRFLFNNLTFLEDRLKQIAEWLREDTDNVSIALHWGLVVPVKAVQLAFNSIRFVLNLLLFGTIKLVEAITWAFNKILFWKTGIPLEVKLPEAKLDAIKAEAGWVMFKTLHNIGSNFERLTMDSVKSGRELRDSFEGSKNDPTLLGNKLLGSVIDELRATYEQQERTANNTQKTAENTEPTSPEFLEETANVLGHSIEAILGVGRDTTLEDMLEELRLANDQREAAAKAALVEESHPKLRS